MPTTGALTDLEGGRPLDDDSAPPRPRSIRELVEFPLAQFAGREFITDPDTGCSLSFDELHRAVSELAAVLRGGGCGQGGRVALVLANGLNGAVATLAVMAAGAVAVPINPKLTAPETAWLLENSAARLLVSDRHHEESLSGTAPASGVVSLDGHEPGNPYRLYPFSRKGSGDAGQGGELPPAFGDPALILYTSGTTGHPKGVILTHGNLLANAGYVRDAHQLTSADVALCVLPIFHINGLVITLLAPLLSAGRVVMPGRFQADRFWTWVSDCRVTWFSAVPTILSLLLSHEQSAPAGLVGLRFARSASASLPVAVLNEFERRFGIPVIEAYGISEAAGQVTSNPQPPLARKPGSAGRPVGNRLSILDENGTALAAGTVGEVALRGANIFAGYLDNPRADREALRDGWFHTGDLGYLDRDGYLFLTGRKKELINRAGEKIAPREVEEVIHRLPEVEAVGVVGVPHPLYGEEVAAFIVLRPGCAPSVERIRSFCRQQLAAFKVPRELFFIDEFPKSPSGKIQRRRLLDVYNRIKQIEIKEKTL